MVHIYNSSLLQIYFHLFFNHEMKCSVMEYISSLLKEKKAGSLPLQVLILICRLCAFFCCHDCYY